jgi:hypothetical protein
VKLVYLAIALAAMTAQAGTITEYFDRVSFDIAAGTVTVESFTPTSHLDIPSGILNSSTNLPDIDLLGGDILPGVTYSTVVDGNSASSNEFNIDAGGGGFAGGFLDSLNQNTVRPLTVAFDAPVQAFGFDTEGLFGGTDQTVQIGATTLTLTLPTTNANFFFGFVSTAADIGGAVISSNGTSSGNIYGFAVDNFTFSAESAPAIPEPGTLVLLLAGLSILIVGTRLGALSPPESLPERVPDPRFSTMIASASSPTL